MPRTIAEVTPTPPRLLLTAFEAGRLLSLSERQIYRLVDGGEIRAVRIRSSVRIPQSEVDRFIAELTDPSAQAKAS